MLWFVFAFLAAIAEATKDFVSKKTMKTTNPYAAAWALLTFTLPFLLLGLLVTGIPTIGPLYLVAVLANAIVYILAVLLYMKAINASDLSLTLPMIAFTPAFMLLMGPIILNELPNEIGIFGVLTVVIGAYILKLKDVKKGTLQPFISLAKEKGPLYMLIVALLFSFTSTTAKLAVNESSPIFAMVGIYFFAMLLFTAYCIFAKKISEKDITKNWKGLLGIGLFMAISELGLVYAYTLTLAVFAIAVKRLSIIIGSLYGFKFFKEKDIAIRLIGSAIMIIGIFVISFS